MSLARHGFPDLHCKKLPFSKKGSSRELLWPPYFRKRAATTADTPASLMSTVHTIRLPGGKKITENAELHKLQQHVRRE